MKGSGFLAVVGLLVLINVVFVLWWSLKDGVNQTPPRPVRVGTAPPRRQIVKESESVGEFVEKTTKEYAKAKSGAFAYLSVCTNIKTLTAVLVQMELLKLNGAKYPYVVLVSSKIFLRFTF
jgi:hypothetical protein